MKYTKEYLLKKDGVQYRAKISGNPVSGKLSVYKEDVFMCQDKWDGSECKDKKGYKYSWTIFELGENKFLSSQISDLELEEYTLQECKDQKITVITTKAKEANAIYDHYGKDNLFSLDEWREIGFNSPYDSKEVGFCNIPNWWRDQGLSNKSINFNQLILEEKQMKKGKVVAYKLLKDIPDAPIGTLFEKTQDYNIPTATYLWKGQTIGYTTATSYNEAFMSSRPDWFEPVFEEVIPKIGGYEVKRKNKYTATFGCVEIDINHLRGLALAMRNVISSSSSVQINEIRLTNDTFVTLKELDEVIAYLSTK